HRGEFEGIETRPSQAPVLDADSLPSVEGLDTAAGLMRVAGNRRLYAKLLRQFVAQQAEAPARISEALTAGDHAAAERVAHTVKGVAGNLGAGGVQAAAAGPEQGNAAPDGARSDAGARRRAGA